LGKPVSKTDPTIPRLHKGIWHRPGNPSNSPIPFGGHASNSAGQPIAWIAGKHGLDDSHVAQVISEFIRGPHSFAFLTPSGDIADSMKKNLCQGIASRLPSQGQRMAVVVDTGTWVKSSIVMHLFSLFLGLKTFEIWIRVCQLEFGL